VPPGSFTTADTPADPGRLRLEPRPFRRIPWHVRFGISWTPDAVPVVLILLLGVVLGPEGFAVLTPRVLAVIDPVLPVTVAALGILVGLDLTRQATEPRWRLLPRASLEAVISGALVSGGVLWLLPRLIDVAPADRWIAAVVAGACAATSAPLPATSSSLARPLVLRLRDLDLLVPSVVLVVALGLARAGTIGGALALTGQAALLAILIAVAAWLLLGGTTSTTEQRVFCVAALLLVGGVAEYLSLSALVSGLVAGAFWGRVGGAARDCVERDMEYLRHPLVVLTLLAAGAHSVFPPSILALGAAYLVLRTAGKLLGGWLARRAPGGPLPEGLGVMLLPPGVFGVAVAVNAIGAIGATAPAVVTTVVLGSIGSQILGASLRPGAPRP
jgi:hypothetical protein